MRFHLTLLLFFLAFSLSAQSWEQRINRKVVIGDTTQVHQLILLDYTRLLGTVTYANGDSIRIQLQSVPEEVAVPTRELRFIGLYSDKNGGGRGNLPAYVPLSDLTMERTALPYQRKGHVKTVMLIYNVSEWNLNDHFQVGAGLGGPLSFIFTQRYRTSLKEWLHVGLSNQVLVVPIVRAFDDGGIPAIGDLTSLLTIGDSRQFLNVGAGLFYLTEDGQKAVRNYRLGIGTQVRKKNSLYAEFLAVVDNSSNLALLPTLNYSVAKRRHRWSYGVFTFWGDEQEFGSVPLPYVSYTYYY